MTAARASIENCRATLRRAEPGRGQRSGLQPVAVGQGPGRGGASAAPSAPAHQVFVVPPLRTIRAESGTTRRGNPHPSGTPRPGQRPAGGALSARRVVRALAVLARAVEGVVVTLKVAAVAALVGVTLAAVLVDLTTPEAPQQRVVDDFTPEPSPESTRSTGESREELQPVLPERNGA